MILLFGSTGYIGSEFKKQLPEQNIKFFCWENTRKTCFDQLQTLSKHQKITIAINAAGYTGKPNVDACEKNKEETFYGNVLWPHLLSQWCSLNNIKLLHVSSGCIYTGNTLDKTGFTEEDEPNFTFKQNNCSFYSGTKALSEQTVLFNEKTYVCRLRIPFESNDNSRNYISKILKYTKLLNAENSCSNKQDFVRVCIEMIKKEVPYGIYNIVNSGSLTTESLIGKLKNTIAKNKNFNIISEKEFYSSCVITPRSNCILNNSKILKCGIQLDHINDSIDKCLKNWRYNEQ
jgi:dTDP-4-dehydrorhamnose reductase